MDQDSYIENRRRLKILGILVVLIIIVVGALMFLQSGYIDRSGIDKNKYTVSVSKRTDILKRTEITGDKQRFGSGDYLVSVFDKGDDSLPVTVQSVSVPTFLRSIKVSVTTKKQFFTTKVLSENAGQTFIKDNSGKYYSFDSNDAMITSLSEQEAFSRYGNPIIDACDESGLVCVSPQPYLGSSIIGLYGTNSQEDNKTLAVYDTISRSVKSIGSKSYPPGPLLTLSINQLDGSFSAYDGQDLMDIYSSVDASPKELKLDNVPTLGDGNVLLSHNKDWIVYVTGQPFEVMQGDDNPKNSSSTPSKEASETVFYLKNVASGREKRFMTIKGEIPRDIAISPKGDFLAVSTTDSVSIYSIDSGKITASHNYGDAQRIQWMDDKHVAYQTGPTTIYSLQVDGEGRKVLGNKNLGIQSFTAYKDQLYVSALQLSSISQNVGGFIVDTTKESANNNDNLGFYPFETNGFSVDYINGEYMVTPLYNPDFTRVSTDTTLVEAYIRQHDDSNPIIRYLN